MRKLNLYISEKLKLNKDSESDVSEFFILVDNWCKKNIKSKYNLTSDDKDASPDNTECLYLKIPYKTDRQLQDISHNLQMELSNDNDTIWSFLDEDTKKILIFEF